MKSFARTIELCALCPVEPACERRQMLEYFSANPPADHGEPPTVQGQPYRCWLLALDEPGDKTE